MKLYEITDELTAIENDLLEAEGEGSDELMSAYFEALDNRDEKLNNYGKLIRNLEAQAEITDFEAKRLSELAEQNRKAAKRLRDRLKFEFQRNKWKPIQTPNFKFTLVNNGGLEPLKGLPDDPNLLPPEYRTEKIVVSANTKAIREALANGETVGDAYLADRGQQLRIR